MAQVTARGADFETITFEAPDGKRLVLAIEDAGVPILHRCGGKARCTTCRVTFNEGEPVDYHWREHEKLEREKRRSANSASPVTSSVKVRWTSTC
jgi:ferredoxin